MGRLFVDVTELASWQGKFTGVPRVMYEICSRFFNGDKTVIFVGWDSTGQRYVPIPFELIKNNKETVEPSDAPKKSRTLLGSLTAMSKRLKRHKKTAVSESNSLDISPGDSLFILCDWHGSDKAFIDEVVKLHSEGVRLLHMGYDMLPLVAPQFSGHATESLNRYAKAIYPLCHKMFSISKHTKRDIANWLKGNNLHVPNIKVIRLGDDFDFAAPKKPVEAPKDSFLLSVGTVEARKNHTLLYYAYKLARERGIELPKIVISGRRGWKTDDIYELITTDPETKDKFVFMNASDEELSWLYDNCLFTVYPSFYEGWGLPVAESVARGVPCASSNTSSMPEIAGNLIEYFSPASTDTCLELISRLMRPKELDKARKKLQSYKPTSWDDTFQSIKKGIGE